MHLRSLAEFPFDSVLLPYSYVALTDPAYRADVGELLAVCAANEVAVQTIKGVSRRRWRDDDARPRFARRTLLRSTVVGMGAVALDPFFFTRVAGASPAQAAGCTPDGPYGPLQAEDGNRIRLPAGFSSRRRAANRSRAGRGAPASSGGSTGAGSWSTSTSPTPTTPRREHPPPTCAPEDSDAATAATATTASTIDGRAPDLQLGRSVAEVVHARCRTGRPRSARPVGCRRG